MLNIILIYESYYTSTGEHRHNTIIVIFQIANIHVN